MKAKVKGKVMLCGPGGVLGCCGKAGQLVDSCWQQGRLTVRRAEFGVRLRGVDDDGTVDGVGAKAARRVWLLSLYSCCCGSKRARQGEGGASAVEAGQSCSRHQGRHFLWGDKERDRRKGKKGTKD